MKTWMKWAMGLGVACSLPLLGAGVWAWQAMPQSPELSVEGNQLQIAGDSEGSEVEVQMLGLEGKVLAKTRVQAGQQIAIPSTVLASQQPTVVVARSAQGQSQYRLTSTAQGSKLETLSKSDQDFVQKGQPGVRNRALSMASTVLDLKLDQRDQLEYLLALLSKAKVEGVAPGPQTVRSALDLAVWTQWLANPPTAAQVESDLKSAGLSFGALHTEISTATSAWLSSLSSGQLQKLRSMWPMVRSSLIQL
jgi:hypothetical protein